MMALYRSTAEKKAETNGPQHSPSRVERIGVFADYTELSTRARLTLSGACPRRNSSRGIIGPALPELLSNWFTSPAEVTGHQKLHSMTDSETALNTRPVVSRGSVSLQITRN
ncbi:hypothetical protein DPMN_057810 [Dreissena polymorpha]|uniref:Uncharacterized protein n=1 Tax=Dreissena polymorpha TaxID=45954 RepID=A0A9D4C0U1_DREPO|nr:hypothetical protein DPMN_057810 [Dreissena polymorpha]